MRADPALRDYSCDRAAIAEGQGPIGAAKTRWLARADVVESLADCRAFADGAPLQACMRLSSLLAHNSARDFVRGWFAEMMPAWRDNPLAHMPFRHSFSGGVGAMQLFRVGPATVSLLVINPAGIGPARTIAFTDCERHEVVLAGQGGPEPTVLRTADLRAAPRCNCGPVRGSMGTLRVRARSCSWTRLSSCCD